MTNNRIRPYKKEENKVVPFETTNGHITIVPEFMVPILSDMSVQYNEDKEYLQLTDKKEFLFNGKIYNSNKKFSSRATRDMAIRILNSTLQIQISDLKHLSDYRLEIHHLDEKPLNNNPENLMLLTSRTHQQTRTKSDRNEDKDKCEKLKDELRDIRNEDLRKGKRFFEYFDIDETKLIYLTKSKDNDVYKTKIDYETLFNIRILDEKEKI